MTISSTTTTAFSESAFSYLERLQGSFNGTNLKAVEDLSRELFLAWTSGRNVFICGNGGSAANAIHIANDLHYGIGACGPGEKRRRMSNPVPGWASLRHVLGASVGLVLGYPFATQDTERNSSDVCARDPRQTSHDLRRAQLINQRQTNLASLIVRRYKKRGGTLTQFQLYLGCNS